MENDRIFIYRKLIFWQIKTTQISNARSLDDLERLVIRFVMKNAIFEYCGILPNLQCRPNQSIVNAIFFPSWCHIIYGSLWYFIGYGSRHRGTVMNGNDQYRFPVNYITFIIFHDVQYHSYQHNRLTHLKIGTYKDVQSIKIFKTK